MKHLTLLVPVGGQNLISVVGALMIFEKANLVWQSKGNKPVFKIELASISKHVKFHQGLFSVHPHTHIGKLKKTDLILIPALAPTDYKRSIKQNKDLVSWIKQQYKNGAEVASLCTGAFLLAAADLVNGKACATHWAAANEFSALFPNVRLAAHSVITEQHGIYTNGGAMSFFNLLLYLIEKYYSRETAVWCAKAFEVDIDRSSQLPYTIFDGQKQHTDEAIKKAQAFIETHSAEKISVEQLSEHFFVGRRNFDRRFKKATGNTPAEYMQRVKIETAKKSLEVSRKNINQVMYDVGYSDVKAFRTVFKKVTGLSPIAYRSKYNPEFVDA